VRPAGVGSSALSRTRAVHSETGLREDLFHVVLKRCISEAMHMDGPMPPEGGFAAREAVRQLRCLTEVRHQGSHVGEGPEGPSPT